MRSDATPDLAIRSLSGEFVDPVAESAFRERAFSDDAAFTRRAIVVVTALFVGFVISDYFVADLTAAFSRSVVLRLLVLGAGIWAVRRVRAARRPGDLELVSVTFAAVVVSAVALLDALIHLGPGAASLDAFLLVSELLVMVGVYLVLVGRFATKVAIGWGAAALYMILHVVAGDADIVQLVNIALFEVLANVLGMMVASQSHRYRRTAFAELLRQQRLNEQLREEVARAETLEGEKNRFFSILAHDLRSPLSTLIEATGVLSEDAAELRPEEIAAHAHAAHSQGRRVLALLENLLEWGRLQLQQSKTEPIPQPLRNAVRRSLELVEPTAREKDVQILDETPDVTVVADAAMLGTILRNLLGNAVKFTPSGGKVKISAQPAGARVEVMVSDTGVGIPAGRLPELFRLDGIASTFGTTGETGAGLGLYLCRELIEKQGGTISVESEPGRGSTFRFTLPAPS